MRQGQPTADSRELDSGSRGPAAQQRGRRRMTSDPVTCRLGGRGHEDPDREPGRDRGAPGPRLPRARARERGGLLRRRPHPASRAGRRPRGAHRPGAGPGVVPGPGARSSRRRARTGAGAVHPGYGFLAENAGFARAVEAAGLVWIGPPPDVIELLGSKTAAREVARRVGVPVVPGSEPLAERRSGSGVRRDASATRSSSRRSGGGGGKGMRVVRRAAEVEEAFARAASEGKAFFADERVYAEKLIERPRHVEVQILGDRHGTLVHFGERECSLQRRHQKVFEECPVGRGGRGPARAPGRGGAGGGPRGGLQVGRDRRVPARPLRRVLLPRGQHPAAGRAPGDRGGLRRRPRRS